ncbi:MAG: hypothetical protein NTW86_18035 [Candidatus Sumerlaeota bacterium]|nr:hypothetical protein [Candidatus Sumerlaeota bacterium]
MSDGSIFLLAMMSILLVFSFLTGVVRMHYDARKKTAAQTLDGDEVETLRRLDEKLNRMEERIRNLETILIDAERRSRV